MQTKSCNLTKSEIKHLIIHYGANLYNNYKDFDSDIERINYLNKRIKTFSESEKVEDKATMTNSEKAADSTGVWPNG